MKTSRFFWLRLGFSTLIATASLTLQAQPSADSVLADSPVAQEVQPTVLPKAKVERPAVVPVANVVQPAVVALPAELPQALPLVDSALVLPQGAPVVWRRDTLFTLYAFLGPLSPAERAEHLISRLEAVLDQGGIDTTAFDAIASAEGYDLRYEGMILGTVTLRDAALLHVSPEVLATQQIRQIRRAEMNRLDRSLFWTLIQRIAALVALVAVLFLIIRYINRIWTWLTDKILGVCKPLLKGVRFRTYEFLSAEREVQLLSWFFRVLKWVVVLVLLYLLFPMVFSIFPSTKGLATQLFGYILNPLGKFGRNFLGYIPELFTIVLILVINHYFIRFMRFLSLEIRQGKLQVPGFYPDWAEPTYSLLRIIAYAFSFVIIFPYLPGSDSPIFRGVSVFLGLLISLGSSSAISNIIAGLVITYMRAFRPGDRVKIGETTGDVIEKTMLVTRLRTIKNEEVTIPNSAILSGSTVNYTASVRDQGLILHTTVTIGYDVPWRQVHELLQTAARKTDHVEAEPVPFVLQTSLDDFYVSYQLNAYTRQPGMAARIYSELHSHIQDGFAQAEVEIMSPHYRAQRDGSTVTIPKTGE